MPAFIPPPPEPVKEFVSLPPSVAAQSAHQPAPIVEAPAPAPAPPPQVQPTHAPELPASYGTSHLSLTARDAKWLYASWDLDTEQQKRCSVQSSSGHPTLRVFRGSIAGLPSHESPVGADARDWFVHVAEPGAVFAAELGFYDKSGAWMSVLQSGSAVTPRDTMAPEAEEKFRTIPVDVPFRQILESAGPTASGDKPLVDAIQKLHSEERAEIPSSGSEQPSGNLRAWSHGQRRALAELVRLDSERKVWIGSLEIAELLQRKVRPEEAGANQADSIGAAANLSSAGFQQGGQGQPAGFWFNVNAELVIYGATESDARLMIGGKPVALRPDGTFSLRFSLPDGIFELPVEATSARTGDTRRAEFAFSRVTRFSGEVGQHPQDPALKPPAVENVA